MLFYSHSQFPQYPFELWRHFTAQCPYTNTYNYVSSFFFFCQLALNLSCCFLLQHNGNRLGNSSGNKKTLIPELAVFDVYAKRS